MASQVSHVSAARKRRRPQSNLRQARASLCPLALQLVRAVRAVRTAITRASHLPTVHGRVRAGMLSPRSALLVDDHCHFAATVPAYSRTRHPAHISPHLRISTEVRQLSLVELGLSLCASLARRFIP